MPVFRSVVFANDMYRGVVLFVSPAISSLPPGVKANAFGLLCRYRPMGGHDGVISPRVCRIAGTVTAQIRRRFSLGWCLRHGIQRRLEMLWEEHGS